MKLDPRTPVLVGAGQFAQRVENPGEGLEPLDLMVEALRAAADDCGAPGILGRADSIRIPLGLWDYSNPAALLGERFGAEGAETGLAPISGNMVQRMITDGAQEIAAGRRDVVLVTGGEAEYSKRRARSRGLALPWTRQKDSVPDNTFGGETDLMTPEEIAAGLVQPAAVFSLFENALRFARGESLEAHRRRISQLWADFNAVAVENPHAWTRQRLDPEEIRTPSASNRMTAFPYTKLMCANMVVDQAAAVILCSVEAARRLGVPSDRWVFFHAATDVQGAPLVSHRADLHSAPELRRAGLRALELAGTSLDEVEHVDLYSCFPAVVQIAANELGLSAPRPLTVTGGLGFAGGPFNSYVLHSTATMMDRLRASPGSLGLVSSVGGWLRKHAFAIYSTTPPEDGFRCADLSNEIADLPVRELEADAVGKASVESFSLRYARGAPLSAVFACLRDDGRRAWATSADPALLEALTREEFCGRRVAIRPGGVLDAE
jgi:acetyl-CoA C-acetyltransferase